ncbi:unnamed protein product [Caenorhabditis bovis]|uniref:Methyltransferase FkbM domain-containing protein n=1 Tax=Caenorhabditis bovis TaxID=2654633 RepID=A0A8S1EDM0_9PELO|nr:unnamed protein product [Caenorhabditis bovis]
MDETKFGILPKTGDSHTIVTLGIGHDTKAEEKLAKIMPNSTEFYGADPDSVINQQLYSKFGTFLPFAVGAKSGISEAVILEKDGKNYSNKTVVHLVDNLWIDVEYTEFELFEMFRKGGQLDKNNITICQFNIEVHPPQSDIHKQQFQQFVFDIIQDQNLQSFPILNFTNRDETKYAILPKNSSDSNLVVTLGIGHDTNAEEKYVKILPADSTKFYGVDPSVEINRDLYSKFGTYLPIAIGVKSGITEALTLGPQRRSYAWRTVLHIGITTFFKDIIQKTFIDHLWMDVEYGEFDLFQLFRVGDELDQNGITICQFNVEVHPPRTDDVLKQKFQNHIVGFVEDRRYLFFKITGGWTFYQVMQRIIVILLLVIAIAHKIATTDSKDSDCTVTDGFMAISCLLKVSEFTDKINTLDFDNRNDVDEFQKSCASLQDCVKSLKCKRNIADGVLKSIKAYCEAVDFVSIEFANCTKKIEAKSAKCFDEWDPFPDVKKEENAPLPVCKDLFGKDNCMKKEITEVCGTADWEGFYATFTSLAKTMNQCTPPVI